MPTCFVIMPLSTPLGVYESVDHFRYALGELHIPAISEAGYEVIPPKVATSAVVLAEIIRNVEMADLIVCDISTLNPNVMFELGMCVARNRPVAMIKDDRTPDIPFDNSLVGCHTYASEMLTWKVREEIPKLAEWIRQTGRQQQNAVWQHLGPADGSDARDGEMETRAAEFDVAVNRLVQVGGLARRRWDYDLGLDPPRRAVRLTFASLPSDYLQAALRREATTLGLTLEFAVRLSPRTGP